jgi:methylenetetrahydrofolate dehydrogenase (NADP+) / methenyltetrahydrofolate cyclohydrolase
MQILSARPLLEEMKKKLKQRAATFKQVQGRAPQLAVVLVGEDPASVIYTSKKGQMALELGFEHVSIKLKESVSIEEVRASLQALNKDACVDGILIQRPLPKRFSEEEVLYWVSPEKDVDAFHPLHAGRLLLGLPSFKPCTPAGVIELLKFYQIAITGQLACVIGRSSIVGKPMAALLLQENATVIQAHSHSRNLSTLTACADLLIVATGKSKKINASFVKPGAVVVDVGIHRDSSGKMSGDVDFEEVVNKVSAITPVPGGVGPMTIMMLMENTMKAAEMRTQSDKE